MGSLVLRPVQKEKMAWYLLFHMGLCEHLSGDVQYQVVTSDNVYIHLPIIMLSKT